MFFQISCLYTDQLFFFLNIVSRVVRCLWKGFDTNKKIVFTAFVVAFSLRLQTETRMDARLKSAFIQCSTCFIRKIKQNVQIIYTYTYFFFFLRFFASRVVRRRPSEENNFLFMMFSNDHQHRENQRRPRAFLSFSWRSSSRSRNDDRLL